MIRVEELRIGNLIMCIQPETMSVKVGWIHIMNMCEEDTGSRYSPIPLTEEILLKAGFVEGENKWFVKEYSTGFTATEKHEIVYNVDSRRCGIQDAGDDSTTAFTVNTEHLHQLQNLFHALTGEELEITL